MSFSKETEKTEGRTEEREGPEYLNLVLNI